MRKKYQQEWRCKTCGTVHQTWTGDPAPTHDCSCGLSEGWLRWTSKHRAAVVVLRKQANGVPVEEELANGNALALAFIEATRLWLAAWGQLPQRTIPVTNVRLFGKR